MLVIHEFVRPFPFLMLDDARLEVAGIRRYDLRGGEFFPFQVEGGTGFSR